MDFNFYQPDIVFRPTLKLAGISSEMNLRHNTTSNLWQTFMPQLNNFQERADQNIYSIEIYPEGYFDNFNSELNFSKWAAVNVNTPATIPESWQRIEIPEGLYAVFIYKGHPSKASIFFTHIFTRWIPDSEYKVDELPHLAIMGTKYNQNSENSEELICIPIIKK